MMSGGVDVGSGALSAERASGGTIAFGDGFVASEAFKAMFREGMDLVEETATYLDSTGREEARLLPRMVALAYATESMRLTTRLMQCAAWLLVQRAVGEGEISSEQARREHDRVRLASQGSVTPAETFESLPEGLRDLVGRSYRMQNRILHLDGLISRKDAEPRDGGPSPVASQLALLRSAFNG